MSYGSWNKARLIEHIERLEAERSVEASVLAVVDAIKKPTSSDLALAELALSLAREIDSPKSDKPAPAAVSKELRAILGGLEVSDDGGLGEELDEMD